MKTNDKRREKPGEKKPNPLGITVKKADDMPEWYGQVVTKAELADYAPVKGCMIIRPHGYALWQSIMDYFNRRLDEHHVKNAYFPLFIPESFFEKEAEHAKGFSPEVAWVQNKDEGSQERLAIRPTSETIMYDAYARWIRSWRDLPLRINQWCNIVRWEVSDVKLFLRSREFLWQEGHCVYETEEECDREVRIFLDEYTGLCEHLLALPVIAGRKTEKEKFAGAKYTTTIEAFMPDGKALQCGTSHNLGQGFAKTFGISYVGKDEKEHHPWQNSWGISTRLIGATILMHGDDKGMVMPPAVAHTQGVIVPIYRDKDKEEVLAQAKKLSASLKGFSIVLDDREGFSPGWKFNEWELKGIPVRIELGPRDIEKRSCVLVRRDTGEKKDVSWKTLNESFSTLLDAIQRSLFEKAKKHLEESIRKVTSYTQLKKAIGERRLVLAPFCGAISCEEKIKEDTGGATARCIPFDQPALGDHQCVACGKKAKHWAYFSKNY
ncbi:MAG: proline--tRNA ligase [DPANN group archaeon]|nr:proline--tRNA ligase [DPANN group archaeon]